MNSWLLLTGLPMMGKRASRYALAVPKCSHLPLPAQKRGDADRTAEKFVVLVGTPLTKGIPLKSLFRGIPLPLALVIVYLHTCVTPVAVLAFLAPTSPYVPGAACTGQGHSRRGACAVLSVLDVAVG